MEKQNKQLSDVHYIVMYFSILEQFLRHLMILMAQNFDMLYRCHCVFKTWCETIKDPNNKKNACYWV